MSTLQVPSNAAPMVNMVPMVVPNLPALPAGYAYVWTPMHPVLLPSGLALPQYQMAVPIPSQAQSLPAVRKSTLAVRRVMRRKKRRAANRKAIPAIDPETGLPIKKKMKKRLYTQDKFRNMLVKVASGEMSAKKAAKLGGHANAYRSLSRALASIKANPAIQVLPTHAEKTREMVAAAKSFELKPCGNPTWRGSAPTPTPTSTPTPPAPEPKKKRVHRTYTQDEFRAMLIRVAKGETSAIKAAIEGGHASAHRSISRALAGLNADPSLQGFPPPEKHRAVVAAATSYELKRVGNPAFLQRRAAEQTTEPAVPPPSPSSG
mmetsp:Transcript_1511/g.2994  ORF Transcript_1511/g.2994 Transcript_1511/m.2994 type:complete len:319 (-) Transcript_1511:595-1551(-)|eukprot:44621-Pleurochrysis_carterae.AAC.1